MRGVEYVIVDEVSILSSLALYWLNKRAKQATGQQSQVFGGLSIIFCGDLAQLPPVHGSQGSVDASASCLCW